VKYGLVDTLKAEKQRCQNIGTGVKKLIGYIVLTNRQKYLVKNLIICQFFDIFVLQYEQV
jgi:hypothetical protein